jgi:ABC-type Fe3+ transport system permease subunit
VKVSGVMHRKGQLAIIVIVISLILMGAQALVWRHSTHRAASETQTIDVESQHPPAEMPGVAGLTLLFLAGVLLSVPTSKAD